MYMEEEELRRPAGTSGEQGSKNRNLQRTCITKPKEPPQKEQAQTPARKHSQLWNGVRGASDVRKTTR